MMEQSESPSSRTSFIEESFTGGEQPVPKEDRDYYSVLEVPTNATQEHLGGSYNRIYNRMIALQHNSVQSEGAAANFRELTEAYEVLSDPIKRRAYDKIHLPAVAPQESMVGRAFAIVSRFSAPITSGTTGGTVGTGAGATPSTSGLSAEVLDAVEILCQQGGIEGSGPPMDPRVGELAWGTGVDGRVDRQAASFYRLSVSSEDVDNGFLIHCKSVSKDKFKLVMFDSGGTLLCKEECTRGSDKQSTEATLHFLSSKIVNKGSNSTELEGEEGDLPALAPKESNLTEKMVSVTSSKRTLSAGQYLLCVYGENLMVKSNYSLIAVMAKNDATEVRNILHIII